MDATETPKCPNCGFWLERPDAFGIRAHLKTESILFPLALVTGVAGAWFPILYAVAGVLVLTLFVRKSRRPAHYYCYKCKCTVPEASLKG
jgi:hypothetical protein